VVSDSRSDQWQLAATCFAAPRANPPPDGVPPIQLMRPDCPRALAGIIDRALSADGKRFPSIAALLRSIGSTHRRTHDGRAGGRRRETSRARSPKRGPAGRLPTTRCSPRSAPARSAPCARGATSRSAAKWRSSCSICASRARSIVGRFRREARLAAQLAHPAIVPIFDWDSRGDVAWYTMELAEADRSRISSRDRAAHAQ
jgi:serine/threonine-protein kinase